MSYIESAFDAIIPDAILPQEWYVCLMEKTSTYGGPEEGGWWRHDSILVKYKEFPSEETANKAAESVRKLAEEMSAEERGIHGEYCLRSMEWLEARGLDADFLPEPDGPSEYYVLVCEEIPQNYYSPSEYE